MRRKNEQRGVVLVASVMTMAFIAMLSLAMLMQSISTSKAQTGSVSGEKAFQIAETGIDAALRELSFREDGIDNDKDASVDEADESDGTAYMTMGGGSFTTSVFDYGDDTFDVTSIGTHKNVSRTVQVSATIFQFPDVPGALTLVNEPGVDGAQVNFDGNAFTVDGNDTNPNGTAGAGVDLPGIVVFDDPSVADVNAALRFPDNVLGAGGDPSVVNLDGLVNLNLPLLLRTSDRFRAVADVYYPQDTNRINNARFGTPANPQVTVIGDQLTIGGGSSGAGVLVIDGDLEIRGNFNFQGLIIVTGRGNMKLGNLSMAGTTKVYGAILVGVPTDSSITGDLDVRGNIDVAYSAQTIAAARAMLNADLKRPAVVSWRRIWVTNN